MVSKANRPPEGTGGAGVDSDLDSNKFNQRDTETDAQKQLAGRLRAYRVNRNLVVEACHYA